MLEKAQETLGRQNLGAVGLEATKLQLSELVSKVSSQCLNSAFSDRLKEIQGFSPHQQTQTNQPNTNDCSMDSCLTSCEGSQKEQEIQNGGMSLRPFNVHTFMERKEVFPTIPNSDASEKFEDSPKLSVSVPPLKEEENNTNVISGGKRMLSDQQTDKKVRLFFPSYLSMVSP